MTFETFILNLNAAGWRLGSLCQLYEGWYACLIDDEEFVHAASGTNLLETLENALAKSSVGRLYDSERALREAEEATNKINLASLGLLRKREPLKRRF